MFNCTTSCFHFIECALCLFVYMSAYTRQVSQGCYLTRESNAEVQHSYVVVHIRQT